jgi:methionyl aminopeptidase
MPIILKSGAEIDLMARAARLAVRLHEVIASRVAPGASTRDLEELAVREMADSGAIPAFLGYHGYPGRIIFDVNDHVTNSAPSSVILREGDIVGVTTGVSLDGWCAKKHVTYRVGSVPDTLERLITTAEGALAAAIKLCHPGKRTGEVSHAIQRHAEDHGLAVVREYVGHGIGRVLHEDPQMPNFGSPAAGPELRPGMVLCLIPIVIAGDWRTKRAENEWDVLTLDGSLSAYASDMVAIMEDGSRVLTVPSQAIAGGASDADARSPEPNRF